MQKVYKKYLPSMVYGGSDGAVSYFTLMAGAYGAGLSIKVLIAIGISNVIADAFSMASADYLSENSKDRSDSAATLKSSLATFISFLILGLIPLTPTLFAYNRTISSDSPLSLSVFLLSSLLTLLSFSYIGYIRGKILKRKLTRTILESIIICSLSASVAYFVGEYLARILTI